MELPGSANGAGNETRTRDPDLGKVVLYQLSYSRKQCAEQARNCRSAPHEVKAMAHRFSSGHAARKYAAIEISVATAATTVRITPSR